jgi:hypothetical protein
MLSLLSATSDDAKTQSGVTDDWRLVVVRRLKRDGAVFTLAELNAPDVMRIMDSKESVFAEMASWNTSSLQSQTLQKHSSSSSLNRSGKANSPGDTALLIPRFRFVNVSASIRLSFKNVPEIPDNYVCTVYVTPSMTAESIVETLINDFSLRPGSIVDSKNDSNSTVKYLMNEIKEFSNGSLEIRKLGASDLPLLLRTQAQPLLANSTLFDHYFQFTIQESWLARMNTQAIRLKEKIRSTSSLNNITSSPSFSSKSHSNLTKNGDRGSLEVSTQDSPTTLRKKEVLRLLGNSDENDSRQQALNK